MVIFLKAGITELSTPVLATEYVLFIDFLSLLLMASSHCTLLRLLYCGVPPNFSVRVQQVEGDEGSNCLL